MKKRQWKKDARSIAVFVTLLVACSTPSTSTSQGGLTTVSFVPSCGQAGDVVTVTLTAKRMCVDPPHARVAFHPGELVQPNDTQKGPTSDDVQACNYRVTVPDSARTGTVLVRVSDNAGGTKVVPVFETTTASTDPDIDDYTSADVFTIPCPPEAGAPEAGVDAEAGTPTSPMAEAFCNLAYGALANKVDACCTAADKAKNEGFGIVGKTQGGLQGCKKQITISEGKGRIEINQPELDLCNQLATALNGAGCYEALVVWRHTIGSPVLEACRGAIAGKQARGQPCGNSYECSAGDRCVGETHSSTGITDGTCQAQGDVGAACDNNPTILPHLGFHPECTVGNVCGASGMCVAGIANGQACSTDLSCQSGICSNFSCVAQLLDVGASCTSKLDCFQELQCSTGTCQPELAATAACGTTPACRGLCESNLCVSFCGSN